MTLVVSQALSNTPGKLCPLAWGSSLGLPSHESGSHSLLLCSLQIPGSVLLSLGSPPPAPLGTLRDVRVHIVLAQPSQTLYETLQFVAIFFKLIFKVN